MDLEVGKTLGPRGTIHVHGKRFCRPHLLLPLTSRQARIQTWLNFDPFSCSRFHIGMAPLTGRQKGTKDQSVNTWLLAR